jgi:probable F420-dependent oxidoreductase
VRRSGSGAGGDRPRLCLSLFGAGHLVDGTARGTVVLAGLADAAGIDQVNVTDHVVMGHRPDRYPYGAFPVPVDHDWPEPLQVLAACAAVTSEVRLATGVLIAPLRPAALLAKQVATLDVLSSGRVDLGIGVGWQPEEYAAGRMPFEERWGRLDDTVRAARLLWSGASVALQTASFVLDDVVCRPVPVQERVPVWFGVAATPRQARRIAELGDGWIPMSRDLERITEGVATVHAAFRDAGRASTELTVRTKLPGVPEFAAPVGERAEVALSRAPAALTAGVDVLDVALAEHVRERQDVEPFLEALVAVRDRLRAGSGSAS